MTRDETPNGVREVNLERSETMIAKSYKVTILFTDGILKGLTHTGVWSRFDAPVIGYECIDPVGGSPYRIIAVETA